MAHPRNKVAAWKSSKPLSPTSNNYTPTLILKKILRLLTKVEMVFQDYKTLMYALKFELKWI